MCYWPAAVVAAGAHRRSAVAEEGCADLCSAPVEHSAERSAVGAAVAAGNAAALNSDIGPVAVAAGSVVEAVVAEDFEGAEERRLAGSAIGRS